MNYRTIAGVVIGLGLIIHLYAAEKAVPLRSFENIAIGLTKDYGFELKDIIKGSQDYLIEEESLIKDAFEGSVATVYVSLKDQTVIITHKVETLKKTYQVHIAFSQQNFRVLKHETGFYKVN